jgi:hypothetical protein
VVVLLREKESRCGEKKLDGVRVSPSLATHRQRGLGLAAAMRERKGGVGK